MARPHSSPHAQVTAARTTTSSSAADRPAASSPPSSPGARACSLLEGGPRAEEHPETLIAVGLQRRVHQRRGHGRALHRAHKKDAARQRVFAGTGTVMGGSGSVNGMVYTRGARRRLRRVARGLALGRSAGRLPRDREGAATQSAPRDRMDRGLHLRRGRQRLRAQRGSQRRRSVERHRLRVDVVRERESAQLVRLVHQGRRRAAEPRHPDRRARASTAVRRGQARRRRRVRARRARAPPSRSSARSSSAPARSRRPSCSCCRASVRPIICARSRFPSSPIDRRSARACTIIRTCRSSSEPTRDIETATFRSSTASTEPIPTARCRSSRATPATSTGRRRRR